MEKYVLNRNVHFGSLKTTVVKDTVVVVDREKNEVIINGESHNNVNEIDLCIKTGAIVPSDDKPVVKKSSKATKEEAKESKMQVHQSDVKTVEQKKPVNKYTRKASKMPVIKETEPEKIAIPEKPVEIEDDKKVMEVIHSDEGDVISEIKSKPKRPKGVPATSITMSSSDDVALINEEQGRVVKTIGKSANSKTVVTGNKLVAKHNKNNDAATKAAARAQARKAEIKMKRESASKKGK